MCNKAHAVLYIDDEPEHLLLVQTLLETKLNTLVDIATSSGGAEHFMNSRCYDLVIADVNLLEELGTTLAAKIREVDPEQPILLLTEYMHRGVIEDATRLKLPFIEPGSDVPNTGGLIRKFSQTELPEFMRVVSAILESEFCHRVKQPRPVFRIQFSSSHVKSAEAFLLEERLKAAVAGANKQ